MGSAILYCYRCSTQLREAHFEQGKAYKIDTRACCAACAPEAVRELPPDRVKSLLDQLHGRDEKATRSRPSIRTPRPMPAVPARGLPLPWLIGGFAVVLLVVVLLMSGRSAPPAAAPVPAKTAGGTPAKTTPETPVQTALKQALAFAAKNPDDFAGQIREFEAVVLAGGATPSGEEARRQLALARAAQKEAVERGMLVLERDLEALLKAEAYGRAGKLIDDAKARRKDPQWIFAVEKRARDLKASVELVYAPLREKALDAKGRGAAADVDAVLSRLGAWGLPSYPEKLKQELDGVVTQLLIDDFDAMSPGWKYVGGEEFPGAKGSLTVDGQVKHGGRASFRLHGDFIGGGAYVGVWLDILGRLGGRDVKELRLWMKSSTRGSFGIRLADGSGQVHQRHVNLPGGPSGEWQEVVLRIQDLVGGERWGGANDGKWHAPLKGLGINAGRSVEPGQKDLKPAEVWFDDLVGVLAEPERR